MRLDERERPSCVKEVEMSRSLPFMEKVESLCLLEVIVNGVLL